MSEPLRGQRRWGPGSADRGPQNPRLQRRLSRRGIAAQVRSRTVEAGKPMRPDVAAAFDHMAAAARSEAGLYLSINSAFRSDAEPARLFAQNPNSHLFSAL